MFIKNKNTFLLLENIKQAKEFLKDRVGGELNDDNAYYSLFKEIVEKLKKTPNLVYTFTKLIYGDGDGIAENHEEAKRLIDWVNNNRNIVKQLPKNLTEYESLEELSDAIVQLESKRKVDKFYKSLYSSMRKQVDELGEEEKKQFNDLAEIFMNLSDDLKKQFTPLKYFEKNRVSITEFISILDKFINSADINEEKKRVLQYIKDNNLETVYNDHNVIAIIADNKEAVCDLGSQKWCIVYSENYYKQYLGEDKLSTQYVIYNFNLPASNPNSMFGITIKPNGQIMGSGASQNKNNSFVPLYEIYEMTGIPDGTLKSKYKDLYDQKKKQYEELVTDFSFVKLIEFTKNLNDNIIKVDNIHLRQLWVDSKDSISEFLDEYFTIVKDDPDAIRVLNGGTKPALFRLFFGSGKADKSAVEVYNEMCDYFREFDLDTIINKLQKLNKDFELEDLFGRVTFVNLLYDKCNKDQDLLVETIYKNEFLHKNLIPLSKTDYKGSGIKNEVLEDLSFSNFIVLRRIFITSVGSNMKMYSADEILEGYNTIEEKVDKTLNNLEDRYHSKWKDLIKEDIKKYVIEYLIPDNIYETFLIEGEVKTFKEYIIVYNKLKVILEEEEDDYDTLLENFYPIIKYFISMPKENYIDEEQKYSLDYYLSITLDNEIDFFDEEPDSTENSDLVELVGETVIKYNINSNDHFILYTMSKIDKTYDKDFLEAIGLEYDEEFKVWYTEKTYGDLEEYYDQSNYKVDLEDYWENFDSYYDDYNYHSDNFDEIDINNLKILATYFKNNGFDIDITPLDKYKERISYKKSKEYYREDKELRQLLSDVEDIVKESYEYDDEDNNPYDNIDISDIQSNFDRAYSSANATARSDEWWNDTVSNLDKIFNYWPEGARAFGGGSNGLLKWNEKNDSLRVIPDVWTMLEDDLLPLVSEYEALSEMSIDNIIEAYLSEEGQIEPGRDEGYASMKEGHYEEFNDRFGEDIYSLDDNSNESVIIKYSDFLVEEKTIEEMPSHFKSEFNDDERAKEDLEYYNKAIEELQKNGGEVYRLVFLEDISDLDVSDLGEHWCIEKDQLSNFYESLKGENEGNPYLIIGNLKPNQIDEESSYDSFGQLPHELEINLKTNPIDYNVIPYRGTPDADTIWTNNLV